MTCAFSKEVLSLYVGGDLSEGSARTTTDHLERCTECRVFCEGLEKSQAVLKSLRKETAHTSDIASVRQHVLSRIDDAKHALGPLVRFERFIFIQFLRRPYAFAAVAAFAVVSMSLLAQIRPNRPIRLAAAVFDAQDNLSRPVNYRNWVFLGGSTGTAHADFTEHVTNRGVRVSPNVYIEPTAYRVFQSTGEFPEGTVMVLELATAERNVVELLASVKDSDRFPGGWGYFGFFEQDGDPGVKAQAFSDANGCRGCHGARAETDHVFTQFYPALKVRRG